jgi:hypothetical protein
MAELARLFRLRIVLQRHSRPPLDCSCKSAQTCASRAVTWPWQHHAQGVRFGNARRGFFRNVTLLTKKERARCLYMSIGVINMACPR